MQVVEGVFCLSDVQLTVSKSHSASPLNSAMSSFSNADRSAAAEAFLSSSSSSLAVGGRRQKRHREQLWRRRRRLRSVPCAASPPPPRCLASWWAPSTASDTFLDSKAPHSMRASPPPGSGTWRCDPWRFCSWSCAPHRRGARCRNSRATAPRASRVPSLRRRSPPTTPAMARLVPLPDSTTRKRKFLSPSR